MKKYGVSKHAADRAVQRLGILPEHASNYLNQLMQTAYNVGECGTNTKYGKGSEVYDHYKTKTRLIVSNDVIVTVYKFPEQEYVKQNPDIPSFFMEDIRQVIKRKFAKAEREFKRKERQLTIEFAEYNLEMAQQSLSFAKAKSPKVKASLKENISELKAKANRIQSELNDNADKFSEVKRGAEAYL
jgi:hypothetical protein